MIKLTKLFTLLLSVLLTSQMSSQMTITGSVTDKNSEALIGVNILIKGSNQGTVTDIDGSYELSASNGDVLIFSYTGYSSQEVAVQNAAQIDVVLDEDAALLDEVVVVGYSTQKKANLTGAVATIGAAELESRPITNASQSLQGQVSGVWVNQGSGEPGQDGATINIRGIGTLNNSSPLILVDGIEAPFGNIDPNDIESVTVLKDAASASIYGSRAANGVVLVTTKRGKPNQKPTFSYSGYAGTTDVTSTPGYVWNSQQFMNLRNEADANSGNPGLYPADVVSQYGSGPNTNWFDEILRKGSIQQHNLSISGGSEKTNFNISLGYLDQQGIVRNAGGSQRYNARLNLDTKVTDKFKIGGSFYISRQESDLDNVSQDGGVLARATRLGPNFPAYDDQGRIADRDRTLNSIELSIPNILAEVQSYNRLLRDNNFLGSFYGEYEVIPNLKIKGTVAANNTTNDDQFFNRRYETFDWRTGDLGLVWLENRSLTNAFDETLNITSWLQATYEKSFDKHNFKFLAGANQESSKTRFFQATRTELPSNSLAALSTGNPQTSTNSGGASEWALRSFFGRVNYDYDDKYLFEANIRRDGSSRFGANNRWGVFPSFSVGWVVSQEEFFNKNGFVDFFKIRASWGQLGNQNLGEVNGRPNNYPFASSISFNPAYTFGGAIYGAAAQTSLGNPDIKWETTTQTDIGMNLTMLDGRWEVEADYFVREASDILFDQSNPGVTGVRTPTTVNIARVQNTGWELRSNYRHKIGSNAAFTLGFNITHVKSEVKSIDPGIAGDADRVFQGDFIIQRGSPINALYGLNVLGIFQNQAEIDGAPDQSSFAAPQPGDLRYEDINGDGLITTDDRQVLGQDNPTLLYGLNLGFEIGGFDVRALFQGIGDAQVFERSRIYAPFANSGGVSTIWEDRWTPNNPEATLPRITIGQGGVNHNVAHSAFISDRTYFRLKNLQIGYNLPSSLLSNNFVQSARVFVNGTNLLTITDYVGFDPELPPRTTNAFSAYPQLRILTGGVNIKF